MCFAASLWRHAKLNNQVGLFKVVDGIWQLRGFDLANITLIEGKTGWIVVDTLTTQETAAAAMALMGVVLKQACVEGFVRLLLDEGPPVGALLRRVHAALHEASGARPDPIFDDYLQRLLQIIGPESDEAIADQAGAAALAGVHPALAEALTRKEIRVLQLLAEGYSNSAMAEKLFVSDSTVRTHLRNINLKLDARSRTQAVAIARRLGLMR